MKVNVVNVWVNVWVMMLKDVWESEFVSWDELLVLVIEYVKSKMEEFECEGARCGNGSDEEDDKDGDGKWKWWKR